MSSLIFSFYGEQTGADQGFYPVDHRCCFPLSDMFYKESISEFLPEAEIIAQMQIQAIYSF